MNEVIAILSKASEKEINEMERFDENADYFDKNISGNPKYFGKLVIIDNKKVKYASEDGKKISEAIKRLAEAGNKTAYWSYVYEKNEGEALNT